MGVAEISVSVAPAFVVTFGVPRIDSVEEDSLSEFVGLMFPIVAVACSVFFDLSFWQATKKRSIEIIQIKVMATTFFFMFYTSSIPGRVLLSLSKSVHSVKIGLIVKE